MKYKLLVADDEKDIIRLLKLYLEKDDIQITEASNGLTAWELLNQENFDLLLIDIMMPEINGFELIKKVRAKSNVPIMVISACIDSSDRIFGLELGADDYITKPFDALEVVARVKATLRRFHQLGASPKQEPQNIQVGQLILNVTTCQLIKDSEIIDLSATEFRVFKEMMEAPGRVFTKDHLYEIGWVDKAVDDNAIRVMISKLREKVGPEHIKTIRGLGYRLEKPHE
ncbi:DNA-binding response OmpR family regulator [Enterococcus sp. PF1-24]|uniref:response regulator transcription factor n=1 Tax=unclassified Enterococcus TaxID=2608891 RepID=UPI00247664CE|nr:MULTISPECIES: response regulator transcription factor [unclassified Enterococcus]MDH6365329.1 DNA-binding response OmpR family regulator [Enterococcus sp. PFB1-1]MDH6402415.1 DNA-binding response OmpR family regulator [Enterococcus sp. PF1-24]